METSEADGDNEEEFATGDGVEDTAYSVCASTTDCDHLLLRADVTFRETAGGALLEKFNEQWSALLDSKDDEFDERAVFDTLLEQVSAVSEHEASSVFEGGPGQSYEDQSYYYRDATAVAKCFNFSKRLAAAGRAKPRDAK